MSRRPRRNHSAEFKAKVPCWGIATGLEHPISHCLPHSFPVRRDDHGFDAPLFFGGNAAC